jgi:hypothetical protein
MASSTRRGVLVVAIAALATSGCMTGHLLDAGRRREEVVTYREAFVAGDRLVVGYRARVSDDDGDPLGERERWAAVALAVLRGPSMPPVEACPVEWLDRPPADGRVAALVPPDPAAPAPAGAGVRLEVERRDGRDTSVVLHDETGTAYARFYSGALTRIHTAAWAYPLLPLAVVADVVTNPPLLLISPAVIAVGE